MAAYMYVQDARRRTFGRMLGQRLGIASVDSQLMPRYRRDNQLICWGNSTPPNWHAPREYSWLLNTPDHIAVASHKIRTLDALTAAGVPTIEYTTQYRDALEWLRSGSRVYARTVLQGHSGDGLVFIDPETDTEDSLVPSPLYTRDFGTPFKEYRVHILRNQIIDMTQKRRMSEDAALAAGITLPPHRERLQVRTYGNGWVFTRQELQDHPSIRELALLAARSLQHMPMAVVDLVAEWRDGVPVRLAVIEVNTSPGLRSETLIQKYIDNISPLIQR